MTAHSPLTRELIDAGLSHDRPLRSMSELLAEHRALVAFAASIMRAPLGALRAETRRAAAELVLRCEAPNAEGTTP